MQEVPFFYLSARAYAKQTGIGEAEVKKAITKRRARRLYNRQSVQSKSI